MSVPADEARLGEFMGQMMGYMTGGAMCFSIWLGDELGLYRVLETAGPLQAEQVADRTGCHPRLVREWLDGARADNISTNPMAPMAYTASSVVCAPNSLSQDVALGLGAQAGEARLRQVFEDAGYTRFRRAAETPLNLILEARR